jgi:hypothetical protein
MLPTKKIARTNYQRPAQTYQDNLTKQQIKEQLKDYKECNDITMLSVGSHIRYFSTDLKTKKKLFRLGGSVNKIDPEYRFIILTNGTISWSVQIANTTFWKKLTESEYKEELKEELRKEIMTEEQDNNPTQKLEKENSELKKDLKNLFKKNELLTEQLKRIESEIKKNKEKNKEKK